MRRFMPLPWTIVLVVLLAGVYCTIASAATIYCWPGDTCYGTNNADTIYGAPTAADLIYGQDGGDYVEGEGGNDSIFGQGGNDYLIGGRGVNHLHGGRHDDTLDGWGDCLGDEFDGGDGEDTANYMYGAGNSFVGIEHKVRIGTC